MAKVEGKKAAAAARKPARKTAVRPTGKPSPKKAAKATAKPKPSAKRAAKPAGKSAAKPKPAVKPPKPASRPAPKAKAPAKAAAPAAKPAPKPAARAQAAKPAPAAKGKPPAAVAAPVAAPPKPVAAPAAEKKRTRRARPKLTSSGPPTAAWFSQGEKPRPSSFIPAPARAEAPSLVAAPPASSDRLVSAHELTEFVVRTVPVRVDIEATAGRIYLSINPSEVTLKIGEGIEWDFRYLNGADVIVDELSIEFDKPSPFPHVAFKSRRPGAARPHRQLSGAAQGSAAGKRVQYTIRAINSFKTELAVARPWVTVS